MRPNSMWREAWCCTRIHGVVEPFQEPEGLAEPADIGRNQRGLAWCVGGCRLHAARISAIEALLFPRNISAALRPSNPCKPRCQPFQATSEPLQPFGPTG